MKFNKKILKKISIISALSIISGAIFFLGLFLFFEVFYSSKVFPRVIVAGIDVGGKTKDEIKDLLIAETQKWNENPFRLVSEEELEIAKEEFSVNFNIEKTIESLYKIGRSGNIYDQLLERSALLFLGKSNSLVNTVDKIDEKIEELLEDLNIDGVNISLAVEGEEIKETEESSGKKVRESRLRKDILDSAKSLGEEKIEIYFKNVYPSTDINKIEEIKKELEELMDKSVILRDGNKYWNLSSSNIGEWLSINSKKYSPIVLSEDRYKITHYINNMINNSGLMGFVEGELEASLKESELNEYLKEIAEEADVEAKNARLSFSNNKIVIVSQDVNGRKLNLGNTRKSILNALKKDEEEVAISFDITQADVRKDNVDKLGIKKLISQGKSDFSNSSSARIHNVKIGAAKYDGLLIAPGEEFSFNENLGSVDASGGFLPELVIKPGKLVKEYGGGLCQVATTAFRASLYAGLPVTERKNHSFVVNHYFWPFTVAGTDATIYPPHPDLRFVNDTDNYILIQTYSIGEKLYFDFYGDMGTRRSTIDGPTAVSRGDDGSLVTVFSRNVYNGDTLKRIDTFKSYYKPSEDFERETEEDEG